MGLLADEKKLLFLIDKDGDTDDNTSMKATRSTLFMNPNYGRGRYLCKEYRASCSASLTPGYFFCEV